jgi:hypothetical protein
MEHYRLCQGQLYNLGLCLASSRRNRHGRQQVVVAMPGDINADGIVDIFDCVKIALAFGAKPHDPNWDPNSDIDNSHLTDIFDLVIVAIHFGETDP